MSNTKTEIDFEKIIDFVEPNGELLNTDMVINVMKEAIKAARDIILREAADKVIVKYVGMPEGGRIDEDSILNLANSEELNKKLGL